MAALLAIAFATTQGNLLRAEGKISPADRGFQFLLEKPYLPADFDQQVFEALWQVWPEPLRSAAENASPASRRELAYRRYGLTPRPDDPQQRPLQYVVDAQGKWSMNCFSCHGGAVLGATTPGSPNSQFALELLTSDVRKTKLRLGKPMGHMDVGSLFMPLGTDRGTTNAVMFGVALLAYRGPDLSLLPKRLPPPMTHHDMDAPPWWHFHKKRNLYIDGFAPKAHRPLMQFMLVEQNSAEDFASWENDFKEVKAYLESLRAPVYGGPVDRQLAEAGRAVFEVHCAECHGTYHGEGRREQDTYPEIVVPWERIRTDRVRLDALTSSHRSKYRDSWFAEGHRDQVVKQPEGYVAPPLDGVWASAPYFHNGSVPTLWHVLHPEARPVVWQRPTDDLGLPVSEFDAERIGLRVRSLAPGQPDTASEKLDVFDTRGFGKSAAGHDFPSVLDESERAAVLEYLKTL